jgi:hypothetical protein
MTDQPHQQEAMSEGDADLAQLLVDQFANLDDVRPNEARIVRETDAVQFRFGWPLGAWEESLTRSQGEELLRGFRTDFLGAIAPSLAEVVEALGSREVTSSDVHLDPHGRRAEVCFALGSSTTDGAERAEGLRNWGRQVRRNARRQRAEHSRRVAELLRLTESMRQARADR